ncbi:hypothetical protein [Paenibacillus arenilitoris]|uniref:Flagellar hook-length control protein FliK n=1 Tax=Paenibacillus arenilitoris TaxID=2772299 RepID=A0A927CPL7_9BACL|nr:hypothetical protein [Paenibacillus arenilitoris]MBD2870757.1 hypothetical protein [Paenibacillus arenilitoris]
MNISQMMRSFLGESSAGDTRAMELKVGQIVRGVILQVTDNNEALVQINGVQVKAKLELPLQAGQSAMLQVQPQSGGALIMLKQVDPNAVGLPEDTFKEWAKQLALPEQKWAVELVKDLRREGVILNREVAQAFQQAASAMPAGDNAEQWMQASAAAFKRGLPMTEATIGALRQVMFGRSAHELLETLQRQLASTAVQSDGETEAKQLPQAAAKVLNLLADGAALLRAAAAEEGAAGRSAEGSKATAAPSRAAQAQQAGMEDSAAVPASKSGAAAENAEFAGAGGASERLPAAGRGIAGTGAPNWLGQMMKWLGVDHELQLTKPLAADASPANQADAPQGGLTGGMEEGTAPASAEARNRTAGGHSAAQAQHANAGMGTASASLPQAPGDQAESQAREVEARSLMDRSSAAPPSQPAVASDGSPVLDPAKQESKQESLKSALLTLVASEDAPAAVKETAQQLVQQITGQQLLLAPERNNSLLTHVTLFIPLRGQDGSQTASVQIQTRRGRKGELDASNCRLLFNLSMRTLGDTLVDVNVTDKIVSLHLWNDHPAIATLADSTRAEIASSLQNAGYQLLSLRATPLPKAAEDGAVRASAAAAAKRNQPPDLSPFAAARYKGVDYRI